MLTSSDDEHICDVLRFYEQVSKRAGRVDFLRFHPTTVRANIVIALMCINKSNAARFEMNN